MMFVKIGLSAVILLAAQGTTSASADPLTAPIVGERTAEWLAPVPPEKLYGNSYLVGFGGLSNVLIDTGKGLILIDGALPQAAPMIMANVKRLGFKPSDIKYILSTEPHFDHAGGLAALARDTGATVLASPRAAQGLRSGRLAADDPQRAYDHSFPGVARVREIKDGQKLRLGNTVLTAIATPGHTMGSMSWSWQACELRHCRNIIFASSLNPVSADEYRYSAPTSAGIVAGFKRSYAAMKRIQCDILVTAHPSQSPTKARYVEGPGACKTYAETSERALAERLAKEGSQ